MCGSLSRLVPWVAVLRLVLATTGAVVAAPVVAGFVGAEVVAVAAAGFAGCAGWVPCANAAVDRSATAQRRRERDGYACAVSFLTACPAIAETRRWAFYSQSLNGRIRRPADGDSIAERFRTPHGQIVHPPFTPAATVTAVTSWMLTSRSQTYFQITRRRCDHQSQLRALVRLAQRIAGGAAGAKPHCGLMARRSRSICLAASSVRRCRTSMRSSSGVLLRMRPSTTPLPFGTKQQRREVAGARRVVFEQGSDWRGCARRTARPPIHIRPRRDSAP